MKKIYTYIGLGLVLFWSSLAYSQGGTTCATAVSVGEGTYTGNVSNSDGGGLGYPFGGTNNADWYSFTAPCNGTLNVNSCFGGADTYLFIHDATSGCPSAGTSLASNDDFCTMTGTGSNWASQVTIAVTAGTTYYIEWDDTYGISTFTWNLIYTPSGVTGVVSTPTNVSAAIDWNPAGAETTWVLEYGAPGFTPGSGTVINVSGSSDQIISGLNPNTSYEYYIMAGAGPCNLGPFSFTTLPLCPLPTGPNVTAITNTTADLNWNVTPSATAWDVEWGTNGFLLGAGNQDFGLVANIDPLTGLTTQTAYHWYVRAVCDLNMGDGVDTTSFFIGPFSFNTPQVCANPTALNITNNTGFESDLNWTAGGLETEWNVQWGEAGFALNSGGATIINGTASNPLNITGLIPSTSYQFYVQSVCGSTPDSLSAWVGPFTWNTITYCNAPSGLGASGITTSAANLTWTENGTSTDWTIEYGVSGFTPGTGTQVAVTGTPTTALSGLTADTQYCYYVESNCGSTADSASILVGPYCFTTGSLCPKPTSLGVMNITNTAANFVWQAGGSETAWDIEWGMPGFAVGTGAALGTATGTTTNPHYATGLNESAPYQYYVRAACGGGNGNSLWAGPFSFKTLLVNNQPCNAIDVTVDAPMIQHYNTGATLDAGEIITPVTGCTTTTQDGWCDAGGNATVWFKFTAPASGAVEVTTANHNGMTTMATQIAVYSAGDCSVYPSYDLLGANTIEDSFTGSLPPYTGSTVNVCGGLTPGTEYYVVVDHNSFFTAGNFGIAVNEITTTVNAGSGIGASVCENSGTFDLFMSITGNSSTNGTWYNPTVAPGNDFSSSVVDLTGAPAGTYPFFYVDGNLCDADTVETSITIVSGPSAGMNGTLTTCNTYDIVLVQQLNGTPQMGGSWSDDDNAGGVNNGIFDAFGVAAGTYDFTYTVTSGNSCPDATSTVTITLTDCLTLDENGSVALSVYPNPVVDVLTIQNLAIDGNAVIEVLDIQGKVINAIQVAGVYGNYNLDMKNIERGIYVVRITSDNSVQEVRVVKQ